MKLPPALTELGCNARDFGRMMVGVPNYDCYLSHVRAQHPEATPMSEIEFVRNRQAARFGEGGRGGFRCC